jgi:hypothetical protein
MRAARVFLHYFVAMRPRTVPPRSKLVDLPPYLVDALYGEEGRYCVGSAIQRTATNIKASTGAGLSEDSNAGSRVDALWAAFDPLAAVEEEQAHDARVAIEGEAPGVPVLVPYVEKPMLVWLVARYLINVPFVVEFGREHAKFFYGMYDVITPDDAAAMGETFFAGFKAAANGSTPGRLLQVASSGFWLMLAHVVAACFLPATQEPNRGKSLLTAYDKLI